MANAGSVSGPGLRDAAQRTRDAAKYLVAAFGAVGAVLVSGLSLTALPSGRHPVIAAVAVLVAVVAIITAVVLVIRVILPDVMTPSELAAIQQKDPNDKLIRFLNSNKELYGGQSPDLVSFRDRYAAALDKRAQGFDAYIAALSESPRNPATVAATRKTSEVAAAQARFLDEVVQHLLEVAVFVRLQRRFSRVWAPIAVAALVVVGAAAVYAWASTAPSKASPSPVPTPITTTPPPNCVAYYLALDHLADDETPSVLARHPDLFPLDAHAKACGFTSRSQLTAFVAYLSKR